MTSDLLGPVLSQHAIQNQIYPSQIARLTPDEFLQTAGQKALDLYHDLCERMSVEWLEPLHEAGGVPSAWAPPHPARYAILLDGDLVTFEPPDGATPDARIRSTALLIMCLDIGDEYLSELEAATDRYWARAAA